MCYLGFPANAPAPPEAQAAAAQQQGGPEQQAAGKDLRQPSPYADEFMMYCFKVVDCDNPEHTRDDWDTCPFAHVGEVVTRRPPQTHLPKLCPKARRACRKGRACPYAHNVFEHWLHPSRFKTEICQHGGSCTRPMCFFAHYPHEVRHPSPSADEVMAAAEAAGLLGRPAGGCGSSRCSGSCYSGGCCSRRSSATNHDMGAYGMAGAGVGAGALPSAAAAWGLVQPQAALQPAVQPQLRLAPQAQAQLYDPSLDALVSADFVFASQCLQAQQQAAQQARAPAAAASAWSGSDWALLSSGGSTPRLLSGAAAAAAAAAAQYGAGSPPLVPAAPGLAPQLGVGAGAAYDLWPSVQAVPPAAAAGPSAAGGGTASIPSGVLTTEEALLLLAGLPPAAASNYLCALQAEQARVAAATGGFF